MNTAQLKFKIPVYDSAVQHFNHYTNPSSSSVEFGNK